MKSIPNRYAAWGTDDHYIAIGGAVSDQHQAVWHVILHRSTEDGLPPQFQDLVQQTDKQKFAKLVSDVEQYAAKESLPRAKGFCSVIPPP